MYGYHLLCTYGCVKCTYVRKYYIYITDNYMTERTYIDFFKKICNIIKITFIFSSVIIKIHTAAVVKYHPFNSSLEEVLVLVLCHLNCMNRKLTSWCLYNFFLITKGCDVKCHICHVTSGFAFFVFTFFSEIKSIYRVYQSMVVQLM